MLVEFDLSRTWQVIRCLSSNLSQSLGLQVWHVQQNQQAYIMKYLTDVAGISQQRQHQHEINFYLKQQQHSWLLDFKVIDHMDANAIDHQLKPTCCSPMLILPLADVWFPNIDTLHDDLLLLCDVVDQFHQAGLIHGDLKLQHVLKWQGQLKLIDFAHTQLLDNEVEIIEQGGTPAYMAPELFLGKPKTIQSDIYALGVIFYQILTSEKPFKAMHYYDWAVAHCQHPVPQLPQQHKSYQNLIDNMLVKHQANRLKDLNEVKKQLILIKNSNFADNLSERIVF